jgi:hypothetical protein
MASTSETGHTKNATNFQDLISFCTSYGAAYNPSKEALKLPALKTQLVNATAALTALKTAKANYDNATNAREILFKGVKPLSTKIAGALTASGATKQTQDDARTVQNKIQGRRAKAVEKPIVVEGQDPAPAKNNSTSQQSFDYMIDHFEKLIAVLATEPSYAPNEGELKVTGLNLLLADLKAKNVAVVDTNTAVSNARITRNKVLYEETNGVVDTSLGVKAYVKSLYGASSAQYKQVIGLKFVKLDS